jgi:arylsulfatase A-like enzyme
MAADKKPNILVIWGDDIGMWNLSCYSQGMMGYRTPNIDRIANEGMIFTDSYGEQSCTAGRSAFITGQSVFRTGLSKVGMPGAELGMRAEDPTIAELLRPLGYATGQFGKNHLGDRDEHLPTNHGFDEFFGNLYHLNAEEEPELRDYPPAVEIIQSLHTILGTVASAIKLALESVSVFCVAIGLFTAWGIAFSHFFRTGRFISRPPPCI